MHGVGELGRRLLAELAKALRDALERGALGRVGVGEHADGKADDHRVDARLEQGDPDRASEHEVEAGCGGRAA